MLQAELQGQAGVGLGLLQHGCMRCLASLETAAAAAWLLLQVSCCGLEELLQLCKKHHAATSTWLGAGWKDLSQMRPLLDLPPRKRYSRQHMPEVGAGPGHQGLCWI